MCVHLCVCVCVCVCVYLSVCLCVWLCVFLYLTFYCRPKSKTDGSWRREATGRSVSHELTPYPLSSRCICCSQITRLSFWPLGHRCQVCSSNHSLGVMPRLVPTEHTISPTNPSTVHVQHECSLNICVGCTKQARSSAISFLLLFIFFFIVVFWTAFYFIA